MIFLNKKKNSSASSASSQKSNSKCSFRDFDEKKDYVNRCHLRHPTTPKSTPCSKLQDYTMAESPVGDESSFEKHRDHLVQEIQNAMDSVVYNLEVLNRSLHDSIEVGKEFENVGKLWNSFYDGAEAEKNLKQQKAQEVLQPALAPSNSETTPDHNE